ncbi:MAG: MFS transporter [Chloroherpetonaceae bacterium]|nr:MFS transporter [Chloroherpetonaceae bacterium]
MKSPLTLILHRSVIIGALGYFVDIYDLLLFGIVRIESLKSLGVAESAFLPVGAFLINMQMTGLLLGGVLWGILGDKKGRLSVLFGSILLYSLANIANAFVQDVTTYGVLRFIAGIGLAGELGAAITLVSESLPREVRGYGTSIVAGIGVLGAVVAALIGDAFPWRTAYLIGGGMGLLLLALRVSMLESGLYEKAKSSAATRGNFFQLFSNQSLFTKYLACIAIGIPIWYAIGILITFSPEFAKALDISGKVKAGEAIMYSYIGLSIGDFASGIISQWFQSRRKTVLMFLLLTAASTALYFLLPVRTPVAFYFICLLIGISTGYWAIFVTTAAESFGTNLRATVATSVPNFVRGSVVPMTLLFQFFAGKLGLVWGGVLLGVISLTLALWALRSLKESFHTDLNYLETP